MPPARFSFALLLLIVPATLVAQEPLAKERVYAWKLGVKLSKVAWVHYRGAPPDVYQGELDACRQLAEKGLKTKVVDFPTKAADATKREVQALNYISDVGAKPIAKDLQANFGESMAGLFELAMKARLAVLLYAEGKPEDSMNKSLVSGLRSAGERSGLPEKLWEARRGRHRKQWQPQRRQSRRGEAGRERDRGTGGENEGLARFGSGARKIPVAELVRVQNGGVGV